MFRARGFIFSKTAVYRVMVRYSVLYYFFWVIPRHLNFMFRRFGTLFNRHRRCKQEEFFPRFPSAWTVWVLLTPHMKMEQPDGSETSAHKIQAPGNHPKEITQEFRTRRKFQINNGVVCLHANGVSLYCMWNTLYRTIAVNITVFLKMNLWVRNM